MNQGFELVVNPYGNKDSAKRRGMLLHGPWLAEYLADYRAAGVKALYLNSAKGWSDFDVTFLAELTDLEELSIIAPQVTGLEVLSCLSELRQFEFTGSTKSTVQFDKLSRLEKCYLFWWPGAASIFNCTSLRDVTLDGIKSFPSGWWDKWSLSGFAVFNSPIDSLPELSKLASLTKLELANLPKFDGFAPIREMRSLRWLSISGCKRLRSIDFVSSLSSLEVLLLVDDGEIESLAPVRHLHNLKALSFVGSTVIADGDLEGLTTLPRLAMLGFGPKKHYSHKLLKPWSWKNLDQPDKLLAPK